MINQLRKLNLLVVLGGCALLLSFTTYYLFYGRVLIAASLALWFVCSLAVGGRWSMWKRLFFASREQGPDYVLNWQHASYVLMCTLSILTCIIDRSTLVLLLSATLPLFCLVYALAKLRCWLMGCCGDNKGKYAIQLVESALEGALGIALLMLLLSGKTTFALLLFAMIYPSSRFFFQYRKIGKLSFGWHLENWGIAAGSLALMIVIATGSAPRKPVIYTNRTVAGKMITN